MKRYSLYTVVLLISIFFFSCSSTSESSSKSEPSFVTFLKEDLKKRVPEFSNGYFKYVDLSVTDARGSLTETGIEKWRTECIIKVVCLKDGGDITLSNNNVISDLQVKTSPYSNAMTKKGEFYRMRFYSQVEKHDGKWVLVDN
ncbi:MAG: hypothetical protein K9G49_08505 [Taibaiella sp.]|nr:hypothetical protein [Taibaiella sp.]